ncbi:MAG: WD40 repeat domain-containing protein [Bacteroidota bacterium]
MGKKNKANPYVGLRPFDIDESLLFFGRDDQTLELLQRLHEHSFVAVVGSSGSGKSSLLRAGLIPALSGGFLVNNSDKWKVAIMKPGQHPLYNMANAILTKIRGGVSSEDIHQLIQRIGEFGASAIVDLIADFRKEDHFNFFLLIDQFEELFRFSMESNDPVKKDEAIDFVNVFLELSAQEELPFYTVLTMRSDFIGDCSQFHGLPEAMNKSQYLVPRLNRQQLKKVIHGPAKLFGKEYTAYLTSRLLNHLGRVSDELPVLQHSLMRLWEFESESDKDGMLDLEDYKSIGGVERALSIHADEALHELNDKEKKIVRKLFKGLTTIDDYGRKIRKPALLSELSVLTDTGGGALLDIIDHFVKDRRSFLAVQKVADPNDRLIDISHESLIRQWSILDHWVDEENENSSLYIKLTEAHTEYRSGSKGLLGDLELQKFVEWRDKFEPTEAWAKRYGEGFNECMTYLKESEQAQLERKKIERRRIKRMKLLTLTSVVLFMVTILGGFILANKISKDYKNDLGDRLSENADLALKNDPTKAILLEMAAYNVTKNVAYRDEAELLYKGLYSFYKIINKHSELPLKKYNDTVHDYLIAPGYDKLLIEYTSGEVRLVDMKGKLLKQFDSTRVAVMTFSNDGSKLAIGQEKGQILVWDERKKNLKELSRGPLDSLGLTSLTFSTNGEKLAAGDIIGTVTVWNEKGDISYVKDLTENNQYPVVLVKFSKDDSLLFASSYFSNVIFNNEMEQKLTTDTSHYSSYDESGLLHAAAFNDSDTWLVTGGEDRRVRVWKTDGSYTQAFSGHKSEVVFVDFIQYKNTNYVVSESNDHVVILWDMDGNIIQKFIGHTGKISSIKLSEDAASITTESLDLTTRKWMLNEPLKPVLRSKHYGTDFLLTAAFSRGGDTLFTGSKDGLLAFWDREGQMHSILEPEHGDKTAVYNALAFSSDEKYVLTGTHSQLVLEDIKGNLLYRETNIDVSSVTFSKDATKFAVGTNSGEIKWGFVGANNAEVLHGIFKDPDSHTTTSVTFAPDGNSILVGIEERHGAFVIDLEGNILNDFDATTDIRLPVAFSPNGELIVTGYKDTSAALWGTNGKLIQEFKDLNGDCLSVAIAPNGDQIVFGMNNAQIQIFTTDGELYKKLQGHTAPVNIVAYAPDGKTIVSTSTKGGIRLWDTSPRLPLEEFLASDQIEHLTPELKKEYGINE